MSDKTVVEEPGGEVFEDVCGCADYNCVLQIFIPEAVDDEVWEHDYTLIADKCLTALPEGAEFIRQEEGFKIYKMPEEA